jgi:tetratricopeptide (TPR) repeat protein
MHLKKTQSRTGLVATALAFLGSWGFFLFAYPYHLMRREQQNLFLFDGDYIRQTYRGVGWLARFVSDFLEQFFVSPVPASLIVALLLTGIGVVVYRICRHFLKEWPSLGIAALFFVWSFLRECGNLYITRYTVVTLAYLSLVLLALQCRKAWQKPVAAAVLLALGFWALESPFHKHYGKLWSVPKFDYERVIGLDVETSLENWDKVLQLSKVDLYMEEASYCYNLALAMTGRLGDDLLNHSQNHQLALLFPASSEHTIFTNGMAGEAWFQLGDMTQAEQSSITSLQASPKHTGARFLVRLARVNLISGEDGAAMKYLNLLDRSLFYGKWARSMMPGHQDEATRAQIEAARAKLFRKDFVHQSERPRDILVGLLEADPDNLIARNYLLCYDLMCYDLEGFMQDYEEHRIDARLYREAILIWLSRHDRMTPSQVSAYGIDLSEVDRMNRFGRNPAKYKNTYWYYYMKAMYEQQ